MKRIPITSFAKSAALDTTIIKLRKDICNYMIEHVDRYIAFCASNPPTNINREAQFLQDIEALTTSGEWNVSLGDCLPLAVADMYQYTIRNYSSAVNTPVYDIKPSTLVNPEKLVNLAYLAIRGEEHYKAVEKSEASTFNSLTVPKERLPEGTDKEESYTNKTIEKEIFGHECPCVTPHKNEDYQSPPKKVSSRKKRANPEKWIRNIRKRQRVFGKSYVSESGKQVDNRSTKPEDCSKCRFKCNEKVSEECRKHIFTFYYSIGSYERQRDFICEMITIVKPVRSKGKKSVSHQYHIPVDNKKERVCRDFLKKT